MPECSRNIMKRLRDPLAGHNPAAGSYTHREIPDGSLMANTIIRSGSACGAEANRFRIMFIETMRDDEFENQ